MPRQLAAEAWNNFPNFGEHFATIGCICLGKAAILAHAICHCSFESFDGSEKSTPAAVIPDCCASVGEHRWVPTQ